MSGRLEGKQEESYGNLDFLSVQLSLDGSESSQLSKLNIKEEERDIYNLKPTQLWHMYIETSWTTAHYSLDSPNQPANHEAPERDHCFQ